MRMLPRRCARGSSVASGSGGGSESEHLSYPIDLLMFFINLLPTRQAVNNLRFLGLF